MLTRRRRPAGAIRGRVVAARLTHVVVGAGDVAGQGVWVAGRYREVGLEDGGQWWAEGCDVGEIVDGDAFMDRAGGCVPRYRGLFGLDGFC